MFGKVESLRKTQMFSNETFLYWRLPHNLSKVVNPCTPPKTNIPPCCKQVFVQNGSFAFGGSAYVQGRAVNLGDLFLRPMWKDIKSMLLNSSSPQNNQGVKFKEIQNLKPPWPIVTWKCGEASMSNCWMFCGSRQILVPQQGCTWSASVFRTDSSSFPCFGKGGNPKMTFGSGAWWIFLGLLPLFDA